MSGFLEWLEREHPETVSMLKEARGFCMPENPDVVDDAKHYKMWVGCNDWESAITWCWVDLADYHDDRTRLWFQVKFPDGMTCSDDYDPKTTTKARHEECLERGKAHAKDAWKKWVATAKKCIADRRKEDGYGGGNFSRYDWERGFRDALTHPDMQDLVDTHGEMRSEFREKEAAVFEVEGEQTQGIGLRKTLHEILDERGLPGMAVNNPHKDNVELHLDPEHVDEVIEELKRRVKERKGLDLELGESQRGRQMMRDTFIPDEMFDKLRVNNNARWKAVYGIEEDTPENAPWSLDEYKDWARTRYRMQDAEGGLRGMLPARARRQLTDKEYPYAFMYEEPGARKAAAAQTPDPQEVRAILAALKEQLDEQDLEYFLVAGRPGGEGASVFHATGPDGAARNAREAHMKWEQERGIDSQHDWSKRADNLTYLAGLMPRWFRDQYMGGPPRPPQPDPVTAGLYNLTTHLTGAPRLKMPEPEPAPKPSEPPKAMASLVQPHQPPRPEGSLPIAGPPAPVQLPAVATRTDLPVKEAASKKRGCLMLDMPDHVAEEILRFAEDNIPEDELADDGYEKDPHVTILYGFDLGVTLDDLQACDCWPDAKQKFSLGKIKRFKADDNRPDSDVLVIEVRSDDLTKLHKAFKKKFEVVTNYPDYNPHCTLAYVKPGALPELDGRDVFELVTEFESGRILFSTYESDDSEEREQQLVKFATLVDVSPMEKESSALFRRLLSPVLKTVTRKVPKKPVAPQFAIQHPDVAASGHRFFSTAKVDSDKLLKDYRIFPVAADSTDDAVKFVGEGKHWGLHWPTRQTSSGRLGHSQLMVKGLSFPSSEVQTELIKAVKAGRGELDDFVRAMQSANRLVLDATQHAGVQKFFDALKTILTTVTKQGASMTTEMPDVGGSVVSGPPTTGPAAIEAALNAIDLDELEAEQNKVLRAGLVSKRDAAVKTLGIIQGMRRNQTQPSDLLIRNVPVIPPAFRPFAVTGDVFIPGDANELYRDVIAYRKMHQDQRKLFGDLGAGQAGLDLYRAVKAVYGYGESPNPKTRSRGVAGFLKHVTSSSPKFSVVQRRLLSKPQDFVSRGVVIPNADLGPDEIGLPREMAWPKYGIYVQRSLVLSGMSPAQALKHIKDRSPMANYYLEKVIQERPVILSRAPAWHKFNIVAAWPRLVDGDAIQVNTYITDGMNMDFDGDTANVHVPAMDATVEEAKRDLMPSKMLFSDKRWGMVMPKPKHEQVLGLYTAKAREARNTHRFPDEATALRAIRSGRIPLSDEIEIGQS